MLMVGTLPYSSVSKLLLVVAVLVTVASQSHCCSMMSDESPGGAVSDGMVADLVLVLKDVNRIETDGLTAFAISTLIFEVLEDTLFFEAVLASGYIGEVISILVEGQGLTTFFPTGAAIEEATAEATNNTIALNSLFLAKVEEDNPEVDNAVQIVTEIISSAIANSVVLGDYAEEELVDGLNLKTLSGETLTVRLDEDGAKFIENELFDYRAHIVCANLPFLGNYFHIVDDVSIAP